MKQLEPFNNVYNAVHYEVLRAHPKHDAEPLTVAVLSAVNTALSGKVLIGRDELTELYAVLLARGEELGYADDDYRRELIRLVSETP